LTILDAKRNDIASSAAAYADAAFSGMELGGRLHRVWDVDSLTVNPYLGRDGIEPFLKSGRREGRGVFVLVRTSNLGAGQFSGSRLRRSSSVSPCCLRGPGMGTRKPWRLGLWRCWRGGGATYPAELSELRKVMPEVIFLVPGSEHKERPPRTWPPLSLRWTRGHYQQLARNYLFLCSRRTAVGGCRGRRHHGHDPHAGGSNSYGKTRTSLNPFCLAATIATPLARTQLFTLNRSC